MYSPIKYFIDLVYIYCTDFVINVANITGLSYYEINAIIFVLLWPIVTFGLIFIYLKKRLKFSENPKQ